MCKTLKAQRNPLSTRMWLLSLKHHQENSSYQLQEIQKLCIEIVDNLPYQGHLSIYFSKYTKSSELLLLLFINSPRVHTIWILMKKNKKHLRWNPSLEGNSSKKLLPISTIDITPQYAIVLATHSWNPLVFLWVKRDYLAGNTALMWRKGREKKAVLMEVASCPWILMMCTMPLNPFLI